jgi:hypothetical protein
MWLIPQRNSHRFLQNYFQDLTCPHPIHHSSVTWTHLTAKESTKCTRVHDICQTLTVCHSLPYSSFKIYLPPWKLPCRQNSIFFDIQSTASANLFDKTQRIIKKSFHFKCIFSSKKKSQLVVLHKTKTFVSCLRSLTALFLLLHSRAFLLFWT